MRKISNLIKINKLIAVIVIIVLTILLLIAGLKFIIGYSKSDIVSDLEVTTTSIKVETTNITTTFKTTKKTTKKVIKTTKQITTMKEGTYKLTHYGYDCKGCGGNTASGYNVRNTIYYNDSTYGRLRIVAMKNLPLYSVIKIKNYDGIDIIAIVLDRGVGSGVIDLLVQNESTASKLGIRKNIEIELLRSGR